MAQRQQARHRELYDMKCRGATLNVGDLVLVKQTAWKGRHKSQDRWESEEYQVVGQPTPGVPCLYSGRLLQEARPGFYIETSYCPCKVGSHRKVRHWEEAVTDSEEEEEGRAVMPKVARVPKGSPRVTTKPQTSLTPAGPHASSLTEPSPPESISGG